MAAATQDGTASKNKGGDRLVEQYLREIFENKTPYGTIIPMAFKETIPTTAVDDVGDIIRITPKLPAGTVIHSFYGNPSDMDTNGSPALVYDVVYVNEASSVVVTIVSGSNKGQSGSGTDAIADAARGKYVGAGYVALKTTTAAATPAAGTYNYTFNFSIGLMKPGVPGSFKADARA